MRPLDARIGDLSPEAKAEVASRLVAAKRTAKRPAVQVPVERPDASSEAVASFEQEYVLQWEARRPSSPTWNHGWVVDVEGPLDAQRLDEALRMVLARHAVLRTSFDRAALLVPRECRIEDVPFTRVDARSMDEADLSAEIERIANTPFELDGTPLFRLFVFDRGRERSTLLLNWHEVVNDASASELVASELLEHHEALRENRAPNVPMLQLAYADYARDERARLATAEGRAMIDAARARLVGARPLELADFPGDAPVSPEKIAASFRLAEDAVARIEAACRASGSTLFVVAASAVASLLRRRSGQTDFVLLTLTNFRDLRPELAPLAGRFINPVPLRLSAEGDPSWRELFARTRSAALPAIASEAPVPISLVYGSNSPTEHPLGRVSLNVLGNVGPRPPRAFGAMMLSNVRVTGATKARNDLFFAFGRTGPTLFGHIGGAADRYTQETIHSLSAELRATMEGFTLDERAFTSP